MTENAQPFDDRLKRLFFRTAANKTRALPPSQKFTHYTSAEAANLIIGDKAGKPSLLLRAAPVMNDFSEIHHGFGMLSHAIMVKHRPLFEEVSHWIMGSSAETLLSEIRDWSESALSCVFMASLSLHDTKEDNLGRLSMWRAYGGESCGVAMVFNGEAILGYHSIPDLWSSPVLYADKELFADEFQKTFTAILDAKSDLTASYTPLQLKDNLQLALKASVLCTKHRGFCEEKEWRIIYMPSAAAPKFPPEVLTIRGIPQIVHRIVMEDYGDGFNISPDKLIQQVIIGPTQYPKMVGDAIRKRLIDRGISNPNIVYSGIPLRT